MQSVQSMDETANIPSGPDYGEHCVSLASPKYSTLHYESGLSAASFTHSSAF